MNLFKLVVVCLISVSSFSQTKNFIDLHYVETSAKVDTLVVPDRIYLDIILTEKDTKGKVFVEELEMKMQDKLNSLGVDLKKQLSIEDLSSNFKKYFLKQKDVIKTKSYSLLVYDAKTASRVIVGLEEIDISNVHLNKTEYSKIEELKLQLKSRAILKAKQNASALTEPIGQKVGEAIFISDSSQDSRGVLQGQAAGLVVRGYSSSSIKNKYENESLDIEFQKIKVESEVFVKFKLEK